MMKTANPTPDMPTPPPSDAQIVKAFIEEAAVFSAQAKITENEDTARALRQAAEARLVLGDRLQAGKIARAEYVKDASDRIVKAAEKAGQAVADLLNKVYKSAEDMADKDRK